MDIIGFKSFFNKICLRIISDLEMTFEQYVLFDANRFRVSNTQHSVGVG
jgi:hypothetical protein